MANLHLIRDIANEKKILLKEISDKIGLTPGGLQRILSGKSTKIETLEKIADVLDVPITVFFDGGRESQTINPIITELKEKVNQLELKISVLEEQLDDKRQLISLLKESNAIIPYNVWYSQLSPEEKDKENKRRWDIESYSIYADEKGDNIEIFENDLERYLKDLPKNFGDKEMAWRLIEAIARKKRLKLISKKSKKTE